MGARTVYQRSQFGGKPCPIDTSATAPIPPTQWGMRQCNTEVCPEARPWGYKCAAMAQNMRSLAPHREESILPKDEWPYKSLGDTFAAASHGDVCEMQLFSCAKKRLTIFSNMHLVPQLGIKLAPHVSTLSSTRDAMTWLGAIRSIEQEISPFYNNGRVSMAHVAHPRLFTSYFTYARSSTTTAIAESTSQICQCIVEAKGLDEGGGAVSFNSAEL